jgi:hypothetical protein
MRREKKNWAKWTEVGCYLAGLLIYVQGSSLYAIAQGLGSPTVLIACARKYMGVYGIITRDIKETAFLFEKVMFKHEDRSSNGEAHRLARGSVNLASGR